MVSSASNEDKAAHEPYEVFCRGDNGPWQDEFRPARYAMLQDSRVDFEGDDPGSGTYLKVWKLDGGAQVVFSASVAGQWYTYHSPEDLAKAERWVEAHNPKTLSPPPKGDF